MESYMIVTIVQGSHQQESKGELKFPSIGDYMCGTLSLCLRSWSRLANPVLFVHPGRSHLKAFSCFCKCALVLVRSYKGCAVQLC
jgi:hypothetical protein